MKDYSKYKKYKAVSFDLYNTLIVRNVHNASDVFELTDEYYVLMEKTKGIADYRRKRINAEKKAIERHGRYVSLDDIFDCLAESEDISICKKYKEIEKSVEVDIASPNKEVRDIYNYLKKAGKKLYIITDMYLPKDVIEKILKKNEIDSYNGLFISSEYGMDKRSGKLFDKALYKEGLERKELLHIGDNVISDFMMAKMIGIKPILYIKKAGKLNGELHQDVLSEFIQNNYSPDKSWYYEFGFKKLGPLLYGFATWLNNEIVKEKYDRVLFFSREGYVIKQLCESLGKETENFDYFFASRRALQVPFIWLNPEYNDVMSMMFIPYEFNLKWLIESWGLEAGMYEEIAATYELSLTSSFSKYSIKENANLRSFYNAIKKDVISNSKDEYECFCDYFRPYKDDKKIAVVDIGWNGNMQRAFEKMTQELGACIEVQGYYLGCLTRSKNYLHQKMKCYLRSANSLYSDYLIDYYSLTLLEILLSAPHGTVIRYLTGRTVKTGESAFLNTDEYHRIKEIQAGAFAFVKKFDCVGKYLRDDVFFYSKDILKVFSSPNYKESVLLGKLTSMDDESIQIIKCRKRIEYLFHPQMFIADFIDSSWKIGFLKKTFVVNAPYYSMMRLARRIFSKEVTNGCYI